MLFSAVTKMAIYDDPGGTAIIVKGSWAVFAFGCCILTNTSTVAIICDVLVCCVCSVSAAARKWPDSPQRVNDPIDRRKLPVV